MTLTTKEIKKQDRIDNLIMELIIQCAPPEKRGGIDWNIEAIGKIRDTVVEVIVDDLNLFITEMEFYPYE